MKQLGVFAKYWEPGRVKTRLAKSIGAQRAAEIHRANLAAILRRSIGLADRHVLAYWPPEREFEFQSIAGDGWHLQPQINGDLGVRMHFFFEDAFTNSAKRVVLIGSDSPTIRRELIRKAFTNLDTSSVVLGPTDDGGYYLVGARERVPPIFDDIPWSTSHVWERTLTRLRMHDCSHDVLPTWYDIDNVHDLTRLHSELKQTQDETLEELKGIVARALSAND